MKPEFDSLPDNLREHFLWDMDVYYCTYESSEVDAIHNIVGRGYVCETNRRIIDSYWDNLSEEKFLESVCAEINRSKEYISQLEKILGI